MAESFLTLYAANTWTMENSPETKRRLHWILQLIGCVAIIVGTAIEVWDKERRNRSHFKSDHAITGESLQSILFNGLSRYATTAYISNCRIGVNHFHRLINAEWSGVNICVQNPEHNKANLRQNESLYLRDSGVCHWYVWILWSKNQLYYYSTF